MGSDFLFDCCIMDDESGETRTHQRFSGVNTTDDLIRVCAMIIGAKADEIQVKYRDTMLVRGNTMIYLAFLGGTRGHLA